MGRIIGVGLDLNRLPLRRYWGGGAEVINGGD